MYAILTIKRIRLIIKDYYPYGTVKSFVLHCAGNLIRIHIRLIIVVSSEFRGAYFKYQNNPPPRCLPSFLLNPYLRLPSLRSFILPHKTEAAYKRKRRVIQGGHP